MNFSSIYALKMVANYVNGREKRSDGLDEDDWPPCRFDEESCFKGKQVMEKLEFERDENCRKAGCQLTPDVLQKNLPLFMDKYYKQCRSDLSRAAGGHFNLNGGGGGGGHHGYKNNCGKRLNQIRQRAEWEFNLDEGSTELLGREEI